MQLPIYTLIRFDFQSTGTRNLKNCHPVFGLQFVCVLGVIGNSSAL